MGQDFPFDIEYVSNLVGLRVRRRCADGVYTDCPFCGDNRGKLKVNYQTNVWRCNYCGEKGGMLRLYALAKGISTSAANQEICEILMNEGNYFEPAILQPGQPSQRQRKAQCEESQRAEDTVIHRTMTGLLGMLTLYKHHREHLRTARGLTDEQIDNLGYKSTPPFYKCKALTERLIAKGYTVEGVPGFYQKDGQWTVSFPSMLAGFLIPVHGVDGLVRGCQIRLDVPLRNENDPPGKRGAKYVWLSSSGKPGGTPSGSPVHIAGDVHARTVYLTEGILKSDIAHLLMNRTFAGVAGIGNTGQLDLLFEFLAANGTQEIVLAPDIDRYRNKNVNEAVKKITTMVLAKGLRCRLLSWNPNYKGVDDWQIAMMRKKPVKEPETILPEQSCSQRYRIYQLDVSMGKIIPFAFGGIKLLQDAGYDRPPAGEYRMVHDDEIQCSEAEDAHQRLLRLTALYGDNLPEGYRGRNVAPSDVIELYDDFTRKYYYRDEDGFWPVQFSPMLAKHI